MLFDNSNNNIKDNNNSIININNIEVGETRLKLREPCKQAKPATVHKEQAACDKN